MNGRGVCYDVGRVMWGQSWRPAFSLEEAARELQIIRDDLHCSAVRICGEDLNRVMAAGELALEAGLEVWLSPELWDREAKETLEYVVEAAGRAEALHRRRPGRVVLSLGSELTLFMAGIVEGRTFFERLSHPRFWQAVRAGEHNPPLNAYLGRAAERARRVFHGRLTYASVPLETVDWRPFDIVGVDLYRDARVRDRFEGIAADYLRHNRPVAVLESGCCTYHGAADAGGRGFEILDTSGGRESAPPRLKGPYQRDEAEQAREVAAILESLERVGVDAAFVMTFIQPLNPTSAEPLYDLDMASFSLVKSFGGRLGPLGEAHPDAPWEREARGLTYPDMPWEPKEAFWAVARAYGGAAATSSGGGD